MTLSEKIDTFLSEGSSRGYKFTLAEISFEANMILFFICPTQRNRDTQDRCNYKYHAYFIHVEAPI